jgi:hypothetical protein
VLAARDPVFYAHHCNLDKLWSRWNQLARPGLPPGAYENPTDPRFRNRRWTFFDENQQPVSISAGDLLNHRENLRYEYPPASNRYEPLLARYKCEIRKAAARQGPSIRVDKEKAAMLRAEADRGGPIALIVEGLKIPNGARGVFDVEAVRGDRKIRLGSIPTIGDAAMRMPPRKPMMIALDATKAIGELLAEAEPAAICIVPRAAQATFMLMGAAELRSHRP